LWTIPAGWVLAAWAGIAAVGVTPGAEVGAGQDGGDLRALCERRGDQRQVLREADLAGLGHVLRQRHGGLRNGEALGDREQHLVGARLLAGGVVGDLRHRIEDRGGGRQLHLVLGLRQLLQARGVLDAGALFLRVPLRVERRVLGPAVRATMSCCF